VIGQAVVEIDMGDIDFGRQLGERELAVLEAADR